MEFEKYFSLSHTWMQLILYTDTATSKLLKLHKFKACVQI